MASSDPRNIVSLTLFRHKASAYEHPDCGEWRGKFFARYLPVIIRAYKAFYPDWRIVIHHDSSVYTNLYGDVLIGLEKDGIVELEEVAQDPPSLAEASLWRMRPIRMSSLAKVVITRDIDSLPTAREAEMVREFIASEAIAQVIHDSPSHNGLMTGMMAFKVREVCARVDTHDLFFWLRDRGRSDYLDFDVHETDQVILNRHLRPSIADGLLETKGTAIERNTPLERLGRHIGAPFDHREAAVVLSQTGLSSDVSIEWQRIESREKSIGYSINASPAFADNRRRVIIGVDHNLVYAFFTPIVTAMWKAMGFGVEIVALDPIRGS
ncbi:MAG TPA: hypothetical protein VK176_16315, partial [Phycisphaerales bacterium]|nr:hypothetical protein [Phycisphaerales bacterium]